MARKRKSKQHRNRLKRFTKRILLPMTPELYDELVDKWNGGGSLVGFIRDLIKQGLNPGSKAIPERLPALQAEKADAL